MDSLKKEYKIGDLRIIHFSVSYFRLDGGAMFGVVPKPLWSRSIESDNRNRIPMGANLLLLETEEGWLLIDTGIGEKWDEKRRDIYDIELHDPWKALGVSLDDISFVVFTHLHFDHSGGATVKRGDKLVPTFKNARYFVQKKEWEDALNPNERTRASYRTIDFIPLQDRITLIDGERKITEEIRVLPTGGHTRGHQIVIFESKGEKGAFLGDLVPMVNHLPLPYIMAYDNMPLETLSQKKKVYELAIRESWLLFFEHDRTPMAGRLEKIDGKYRLREE